MRLSAENVSFRYSEKSPWILKNVHMEISSGDRTALTGTSGCGKSTLAKILSGYLEPTQGRVLLDGKPLDKSGYCPVQMIYQHPEQAVNSRWRMKKILNEGWDPGEDLLSSMGIEKEWMDRWPSELSGGELQRFCIARALGPESRFLICDEISTMLDVITQAQIWELMLREANEGGLGLIVVTHNMDLANRVCTKNISLPPINMV